MTRVSKSEMKIAEGLNLIHFLASSLQSTRLNTIVLPLIIFLDSLLMLFNFIGGLEDFSMKSNLMNGCALLIKTLKQGCQCGSDNKS